ncbi:MAG: 30S ribosomal protein S6 [Candidatus Pacebacteria bacterium]|nr:30S ribosomal protein S6 [Candidatus Paceibacterota bacterium]
MKFYELSYLIPSDISLEEAKIFSQELADFISSEKGLVKKITDPIKRKLGYSLKNKNEAYLISLSFDLNPENLKELEKKLKTDLLILRYLILNKKEQKEQVRKRMPLRKEGKEKPVEIKKVELKEIDKKIEEILGQ